jgi:hypothetical protein
MSWCLAHSGTCEQILLSVGRFLSEGFCLKVAVLFLWGALSDERTGLQFAVQSLNDPSSSRDSLNLEGPVLISISPRTGWPVIITPCTVSISRYKLSTLYKIHFNTTHLPTSCSPSFFLSFSFLLAFTTISYTHSSSSIRVRCASHRIPLHLSTLIIFGGKFST